jgi:hypothetical protein
MLVRPLTAEAVEYLIPRLRGEDAEELTALRTDGDVEASAMEAFEREGVNFSFCDDEGVPIAMGGFWNGPAPWIMNSWMVASPRLHEIGISFARTVMDMHDQLQENGAVRRIQTACILRHGNTAEKKARRFLEFLGYQIEGTMSAYGASGQAYLIMARIYP